MLPVLRKASLLRLQVHQVGGGGGWLAWDHRWRQQWWWMVVTACLASWYAGPGQTAAFVRPASDDVSTCRLLAGKKRFGVGVGTRNNQSHCTTVRSRETSIAQN